MRRKRMWLGLLATMLIAGNASAINVNGNWDDWFTYDGEWDSNWSQTSAINTLLNPLEVRYQNDSESDANGGQPYDIEQIFYYYEDFSSDFYSGGMLYIGMVAGYRDTDHSYDSGDMFIDFGYASGGFDFDLAIATDSDESSRYRRTWENDGWQTRRVSFTSQLSSSPYRVRDTRSGATPYDNAQVAWGYGVGDGYKHNFLEIGIELNGDMEQLIAENGIGLHWTMECGNDVINVYDPNPLAPTPPPPPTPNAPIPEPATMVLFGVGVAGMLLRARKPVC